MFGRPTFGSSNNSSSPFGNSSGFGNNQNKPTFGSPSTNTGSSFFGQQKPQSVFGSSTGTSLFGSSNTGTTAFGTNNASKSIFGSTTQTASNTGLFGSSNTNTNSSIFGSNANKPTGGLFSSGFGSVSGAPAVVGTTIKFEPVIASDTMMRNGKTENVQAKLMCITIMKQYETKCLEELRVEDYLANRKGPQAGSSTGFFGSTNNTSSGGLFGNSSTNNTSSTGIFGSSTPQKPSLFGSTTQNTGSVFGNTNQTTSGGLFGSSTPTTNNTGGSLFGTPTASTGLFGSTTTSTQPVFGATNNTSGGLFGSKPTTTTFGNTSNTGTSLFGSSTTTNTGFGSNTGTSTFGFGTTATTAPSQQQSTGFSFGNTNTASTGTSIFGSKPAGTTNTFGGFGATSNTTTTGFGNTASTTNTGGLFGNTTAAKPLFGSTTTNTTGTTGGLFGQAPAQTTSLFGNTQSTQPTNTFGTQQPVANMTQQPVSTQVVHQPIVIGSDVNQTAIQQALIDAQIAASPYGCSPLLKLSSEKRDSKGKDDINASSPFSLQRQMKFLAGKNIDPVNSISLAPVNKSLVAPEGNKLNNSRIGGLQYKSVYSPKPNDSLIYKDKSFSRVNPLANISSTSVVSEHNNSAVSGNVSSIINHSLVNKSSSIKTTNLKQVDPVNIATLLKSTPTREKIIDNGHATPVSKNAGLTKRMPLSHSTPHARSDNPSNETCSDIDTSSINHTNDDIPLSVNSEVAPEDESPAGIQLSSQHYYLKPSLEEMKKLISNGKVQLKKGLLISRQGYGSVYWPGSFELSNLVIDDVVIFKRREVTVYPDDENKPPVGEGLNRPAEISLECVWPVDTDTKEYIQDVDRLEEMKFRDRLERVSLKNDSIFLDYKPSTGTWTFKVKHFSKYGFDDADENEAPIEVQKNISKVQGMKRIDNKFVTPLGKSTIEDISSIHMYEDESEGGYFDADGMECCQFFTNEQSFIDFKNPKLRNASFINQNGEDEILKKKMKMDELLNMSATLITNNASFIDKRLEESLNISLPITKRSVELKIRSPVNIIPSFVGNENLILGKIESTFIDLNIFNRKKCSTSVNNNVIFLRENNFAVKPINITSELEMEHCKVISTEMLDIVRSLEVDDENNFVNINRLLTEYIGTLNNFDDAINANEISIYKFLSFFFSSKLMTEDDRLNGIINWISDEVKVYGGSETSKSTGYKLIFECMCEGNIDKACDEAIKMGDFELATSLVEHDMDSSLSRQSEIVTGLWDCFNDNNFQDDYMCRIHMILGGMYEYKLKSGKIIRWDSDLNWKSALGIALNFMSSRKESIKEVVAEFLKYTKCKIVMNDIIILIIKLSCGLEEDSTSIAKAILAFSNYEDYRLCWHVMNVLLSIMTNKINDTTMNTIHLYYAEQLFHSACYKDAFFVLEHLTNDEL
uniref:Nuclear pore complex protein Nup98-Nup96 n=1 Tax=Parastrongyloides trichosuri TaxID=131310 RepID=A0A0N4ZWV4_PARTI